MNCDNLDVWKKSVRLSADVYKYFASCKDYGFKDQITRSGLSIASNIAEGMEKASVKEKLRFLEIAKGSVAEFRTQAYIGVDICYIDKDTGQAWSKDSEHIFAMINKLQGFLRKKVED